MNPSPLKTPDGSTHAWQCSDCGSLWRAEAPARRCCVPPRCAATNCDEPALTGRTLCETHHREHLVAREARRYSEARLDPDPAEPLAYAVDVQGQCGEYVSRGDLLDEEYERDHIYATKEAGPHLCAETTLERAWLDAPEEYHGDVFSPADVAQLQLALDEWLEARKCTPWYVADFSRKLR